MRVLIDATPLLSLKGGIGHYTNKIASALIDSKKFDANFFFVDCFAKKIEDIIYPKENIIKRILNKNLKIKHTVSNYHINRFIKKNKIELFHQPNFISYNLNIKNISTIHDLSWIHFPNFFLKNELKNFDLFFEKTLQNSNKLIVHSNFIKKELCSYFNLQPNKVEVVYEDLRKDFYNLKEKDCLKFLKKFNLKFKKFFLIVNTLDSRKNFNFILDIYSRLKSEIQNKYPLVIFGQKGRYSESIICKIKELENCFYFDYLDEYLLNQCFSSAKIFLYPSLYEGFGISPLESMASGTPVIASNIEATKEILEDNAILLDLNDEFIWINKIEEMLENQEFYHEFQNKGLNHATKFKKNNTINKILNIYERI